MTTKEVIAQVLSDNNLSVKQLSSIISWDLSKLYDLSAGKTKRMPRELAAKISEKFPNYDLFWLLTGNDGGTTVNVDMGDTIKNNTGAVATRGGSVTQTDNPCLQSLLAEKDKQIAQLQSQLDNLTTILKNLTSK